jgi:chromosome segregation ATPase
MKTTNIRNMRDIPTIQGMKNRSVPSNREQIMSELSRLEHEKARLERENTIWLTNQKKTESRIQQVNERMDLLRRKIEELLPKPQVVPSDPEAEKQNGNYHGVNLEY